MLNLRTQARLKRKQRIRKKLVGNENRPRLCVFRSAKHIYAQVIDDSRSHTITAASSVEKTVRENPESKNKLTTANMVGKIVGRRALEKGVARVVFDRNGFLYHGRVKAVSEGAREAGLEF
jgi:large subunit ribosomal protein L18